MFSSRLPDRLASNAVSRALDRLRTSGVTLLDLTESNPTKVGLPYPADLLDALADSRGRQYDPEPFGLAGAREAVAADYVRRRTPVSPEQVALVASTSEAYAVLLKLLCDAGESVLVPQPSYPLFDLLTRLEAVPALPYRLDYHGVWSIDHDSVERAVTASTRALLVVSPNNPTGSMLRAADLDWLDDFCATHGLALIVDEVFADYPLSPRPDACSSIGDRPMLTFTLGGLSKSAGLPQVKLSWIIVNGPRGVVREAIERLEVICDTYLSVSTPVQLAAARLIDRGQSIRSAIAARIAQNLRLLERDVCQGPYRSIGLLSTEAGWSAILQVPATASEEALVLQLLEQAHVLVHPGYFFDFAREAFLVLSLLPDPDVFAEGLRRLLPIAAREPRS